MTSLAASGRSALVVLFLTVFIDLMGFGIVIPLLPIYAERLHATPVVIGALMAVYSLMQLLFARIWGRVSDHVGRRPVLIVSLSSSALSYLMLAAAWSLGAWAVPMLFVARMLAGVAGATIQVAQAYIADVTSDAHRARGMGLIGAAFGLGMVVGPAIGGGLSLLGLRVPELFAAGLCLVNVALAARQLPESLAPALRRSGRPRPARSQAAPRHPVVSVGTLPLYAVLFLVMLCFAVLEGTFSLAATHLFGYGPAPIAGLWFYMGLVAVLVQGWLVGRLARRLGERSLVLGGAGALAVGLIWLPRATGAGTLLAALALVVAGHGLASPSLSSLVSKTVGAAERGEVLGISQSLSAAARVLGPSVGMLIFVMLGPGAPSLAGAACALGALAVALPAVGAARQPEHEALGLRRSG